jgi:5'-3' exonuclease
MGIPTYFGHIVKKHRGVVRAVDESVGGVSVKSTPVDNLYLDCNSIIYDALRKLESTPGDVANKSTQSIAVFEQLLCDATAIKITEYIKRLSPRKRVVLAFDGVAPCGKMQQQRLRRFKGQYDVALRQRISQELAIVTPQSSVTAGFSSIAITPGTGFMTRLSETMHRVFGDPSDFGLDHLIVSCSDEIGEGEHKIFDYIRTNASYHANTTTVVYGLDADLIMLTLNHLRISERIYLFRETPEFIKSVDSSLEPNKLYVLDIPELGDAICSELNAVGATDTLRSNLISDYIFICFLLGNDFLPHFPALNIRTTGHATLVAAYMVTIRPTGNPINHPTAPFVGLTSSGKIIWKRFREFISYLAVHEADGITKDSVIREKMGRSIQRRRPDDRGGNPIDPVDRAMDRYLNLPITNRSVEEYIDTSTDGWEARYYDRLFHIEWVKDRVGQVCRNYMEGLEWTLAYYSTGCVDWRWRYRYHYPPLLSDLQTCIPYFDTQFIEPKPTDAVHPYVQLSYVLPRGQLKLLPDTIRQSLLSVFPESYPTDCSAVWSYCRYMWESHVELPELDIARLSEIIEPLTT